MTEVAFTATPPSQNALYGTSNTYASARTTCAGIFADTSQVGQRLVGSTYYVLRNYLCFDTSSIPLNATILTVNLSLACVGDSTDTDYDVQIIEQDWSAEDPLAAGNMEAAYDNCLAASDYFLWRNTSGISLNTPYIGPNMTTSYVNKSGYTYYSFRSSLDKAGTQPGANDERLYFCHFDDGTAALRPTLIINYHLDNEITIQVSADNMMASNVPTSNYCTNVNIYVGEHNASVQTGRSWIKPDWSTIPTNATITYATLHLAPTADFTSNARIMRAHRCLRATVDDQQTWNLFSTGNSWGTAGASNSTTDYDGATELGNITVPAAPTLDEYSVVMELSVSEIQKFYNGTYTNNGIILFMDTQASDQTRYSSIEGTYPPYIEVFYTTGFVPSVWIL